MKRIIIHLRDGRSITIDGVPPAEADATVAGTDRPKSGWWNFHMHVANGPVSKPVSYLVNTDAIDYIEIGDMP
jgi:hypothetical protein